MIPKGGLDLELYFLRHGLAAGKRGREPADEDRPLTPQGLDEMREVARGLRRMKLSFDVIVSSPYRRARQTAEVVADILKFGKKVRLSEALLPGAHWEDFSNLLEELDADERALFVGHQPTLGRLVSKLISGGDGFSIDLRKGGLARVDTSELGTGVLNELVFLLAPKHISRYH